MSVKILYDVVGGAELEKALRDLREQMRGKEGNIVAKALMKAAYQPWREMQAKAPISGRSLEKAEAVGQATSVSFEGGRVSVTGLKKPKDLPGTLRKSIKRQRHSNPRHLSEIVGIGVFVPKGTTRKNNLGAWYAHFVEFGTKKWKGKPFIRPVFEANQVTIIREYSNHLGSSIEKEGAKIGRKYEGVVNNSKNRIRYKGRA